jgi:hypothetical protein
LWRLIKSGSVGSQKILEFNLSRFSMFLRSSTLTLLELRLFAALTRNRLPEDKLDVALKFPSASLNPSVDVRLDQNVPGAATMLQGSATPQRPDDLKIGKSGLKTELEVSGINVDQIQDIMMCMRYNVS